MSELHIIYRAYPLISKSTLINFASKAEMMELCLQSLECALARTNTSFSFTFISDKCTDEQINIVRDLFGSSATKYDEYLLEGVGNAETFRLQVLSACDSTSEFVLLLEDDYYISPRDIALNLTGLRSGEVQYSTFFYPADADRRVGNMRKSRKALNCGLTAVGLPSTTLTFFARQDTINSDKDIFLTFSKGNHDSSLWLYLTCSFLFYLGNWRRPLFLGDPRLFLSIIRRYIRFFGVKKPLNRTLYFIGDLSSTHLDSGASLNENNIKQLLAAHQAKLVQHE